MKKNRFKILTVACVVGANLIFSSCVDNLLNQTPGVELASSLYWKTESDAEYAVNGVYSQARAMFNRDYVFDGNTDPMEGLCWDVSIEKLKRDTNFEPEVTIDEAIFDLANGI